MKDSNHGKSQMIPYVEDATERILLATERYNTTNPVNLGSSVVPLTFVRLFDSSFVMMLA